MKTNEYQNRDSPKTRGKPRGKPGTNMKVKNNTIANKEEVSRIVSESAQYFKQDKKPPKNNEECRQRLIEFFEFCGEKGQIPTVEDMALSLGVTRSMLWKWERGIRGDEERSKIIRQAKEVIAAIEAKLVEEGKINPVTYIFRAKNYYGLKDRQELSMMPTLDPLGEMTDNETLRRKCLENIYGLSGEDYPFMENNNSDVAKGEKDCEE